MKMRSLKSIIIMIIAVCLTAGCFYLLDTDSMHETGYMTQTVYVTSPLTGRIYSLDRAVSDEDIERFEAYETGLDKEITSYLRAHGGGKYTDSSGETHYVSSSSGGGYSGGGYSGGSSGGGGVYYDDGPGYLVDFDDDETIHNICHNCGTQYLGTGGCPNPECDAYDP